MSHRNTRGSPHIERQVSDEDVFEHVINGIRVSQILQMLRDGGRFESESEIATRDVEVERAALMRFGLPAMPMHLEDICP